MARDKEKQGFHRNPSLKPVPKALCLCQPQSRYAAGFGTRGLERGAMARNERASKRASERERHGERAGLSLPGPQRASGGRGAAASTRALRAPERACGCGEAVCAQGGSGARRVGAGARRAGGEWEAGALRRLRGG